MGHRIIECLVTLALGILMVLLTTKAQPQENVPRIGWLGNTAPSGPSRNRDAFQDGLREMGVLVGQHVLIESRYAARPNEGFALLVAELLHLPVAVLVTTVLAATTAAREATSTTPIVFTGGPIPWPSGSSPAWPGRGGT
jgi:ABC-type uncharacterized transport system substrate-binding protein